MRGDSTCIVSVLVMVMLMMTLVPSAWGEDTVSRTWWRVGFETTTAFSEPVELGPDAASLVNPPESQPGQARLEITLVAVPKDLVESLGNNDSEVFAFVKSTFFGTANPADSTVERSFMGKTARGELQKTTIPKPGELEIYLVPLSNGDKVAVGLTRAQDTPVEEAKQVMDLLSQTLKEVSGQ